MMKMREERRRQSNDQFDMEHSRPTTTILDLQIHQSLLLIPIIRGPWRGKAAFAGYFSSFEARQGVGTRTPGSELFDDGISYICWL